MKAGLISKAVEVALSSPSSKLIMVIWSGRRSAEPAPRMAGRPRIRAVTGLRARVEKQSLAREGSQIYCTASL